MNMNEVLCNRALEILGKPKGRYDIMVRMPPAEGETGGQVLGSQVLKVINESTNQNAAVKRIEFVGPSVGADLAQTGAMALMAALLSILVYVGFRFEWRLAAGVSREPLL